jgi:hypothetical protein
MQCRDEGGPDASRQGSMPHEVNQTACGTDLPREPGKGGRPFEASFQGDGNLAVSGA